MDFFTAEKMIHPVSGAIDPKSRHIPSKWEHKKVGQYYYFDEDTVFLVTLCEIV